MNTCENRACQRRRVLPLVLLLLGTLLTQLPTAARTETELTAVFLVDNVFQGPPSIDVVHVTEVGEATYPGEEVLVAAVADLFSSSPYIYPEYFQALDTVGDFQLIYHMPGDFGGVGLADVRTGAVAFAAGVVWMGTGVTLHPVTDSHPWEFEAGPPAPAPAAFHLMPNFMWSDEYSGTQAYFLEVALNHIRQTDVMRNFGASAPYTVTGYLHTPTVGAVDPLAAVAVLMVSGQAGPPWGPDPVDTTPLALEQVKALFR